MYAGTRRLGDATDDSDFTNLPDDSTVDDGVDFSSTSLTPTLVTTEVYATPVAKPLTVTPVSVAPSSSYVPAPAPASSPSFLTTLLTDLTQIAKPGTATTVPTYSPTSALSTYVGPLLLIGGLAFVLSRKQ